MSNHEIDHADDLSSRVLHARAGGANGRLPSPTRTLAVGPDEPVRTATVADGDELCVSNRSGGPIGVFVEPDPAMLGDWAEALIRENDALAARVAELERHAAMRVKESLGHMNVKMRATQEAGELRASNGRLGRRCQLAEAERDALAARVAEVERERDVAIRELSATAARLARLVDSGDLDGARAMARGILEGEGKTHG